jgi:hypothetical protein
MNYQSWISNKVLNNEEASISLYLLEREFGEPFAMKRISLWANGLAKELGVKATIHMSSNVVTFYPKV